MVATRKSKARPPLRQSKLSFATKRAHSSKTDDKKQAPIRKTGSAPVPASTKEELVPAKRPRSPDPLEISSESDDKIETERPTSKSVKPAKTVVPTPPVVEEIERERLNPRNRKWNKHYASVKKTMGGLPAGERSSLKAPYLVKT